MALGIPGMRLGAPFFITGEPRREYYFKFMLTAPLLRAGAVKPSWTKLLFSSLFLTYVSSLAEQVNLPSNKITMGNVTVGTLKNVPYPEGFETPTFSVVYLEDELDSVYRYHTIWQNNIRGGGGGLQFEPLGNVCCQAVYFATKKMSFSSLFKGNSILKNLPSLEIPSGMDVWPYVFPSEVQRSPANQGGSGISKTTVVYTRVPDTSGWNVVYRDNREYSSKESTANTSKIA
jgi:hypothetical protein